MPITGAIQYRDGTESFGEKLKDAIYKDAKESSEKANIMMGGSCMGEIAGEMKGGFIKNCLAAGDIRVNENYSGMQVLSADRYSSQEIIQKKSVTSPTVNT